MQVYLNELIPGGEINSRSSDGDIESLANSIRQIGMILPIAVMPEGDGKSWRVIDGNRRLAALNKIHNGTAGSTLVTVHVTTDKDIDLAMEQSIAANIERLPLHPMDQYEAFAKLHSNVEEVASHFGITDRQVRQRMALGNLHPQVREVYRNEGLNESTIKKFTRVDHEQQLRVLLGCTNRWQMEQMLDQVLDDKAIHPTSAIARFVTREIYLDNGGTIEADLFKEEDEQRWTDPELVVKLANEKRFALKKKYLTEQDWQFFDECEGWVGQDYEMEEPAGAPKLSKKEQKELDKLEGRLNEIEAEIEQAEGEITNGQEQEIADIEEMINGLTDDKRSWTDEQKSRLGVVIDQNWNVHEGVQRRAAAKPQSGEVPDAAGSEPAEKGLAMSLLNDIDNALTHGAAQVIAREHGMAIRLLVLQLLHNSYQFKLDPMYSFGVRTDAALDNPLGTDGISGFAKPLGKAKTLEAQMKALWKLEDSHIHEILAWFTAGALRKQHRGSDVILYLDKLGKLETRLHYTPTVENFFGRLSKDQLQTLANRENIEIDVGPLKKAVAAEKICAALPDTWLPEAMRPTKVV